jgi:hypothetical protein
MFKFIVKSGELVSDELVSANGLVYLSLDEVATAQPFVTYLTGTTTMDFEVDTDARWAEAKDILQAYVMHPVRAEVSANQESFRAAIQTLGTLRDLGIECPLPFIDGDGDALLMWKKGTSVFIVTITSDAISLLVHKDNRLAFASGELRRQRELPGEIWNQLQVLRRQPSLTLVSNNLTANILTTDTISVDISSILRCTNLQTVPWGTTSLPAPFSYSPNLRGDENRLSGQSTAPSALLMHWAKQKQQEIALNG